jgi:sterol desaturase/sphingolipid hydroxylase (fatty acid hydroxylase superfamily)
MQAIYAILLWSAPAVMAFATIEAIVLLAIRRGAYDWRAALCSLADLNVREYLVNAYLAFGPIDPLIGFVWAHRIATVPLGSVTSIAVLFIGQELCYYWLHRGFHRVGFLWAHHAVHHSTNEMNLSAALRTGWTGRLVGASAFFLPLIWLGFAPRAVFITLTLNLLYEFFIHTDWMPKLGPLEWVLNTPSHHRVHHATNPKYLDKNYGGVLIVFDRLFGTFTAERDDLKCRYGLIVPLRSYNPHWIAFHGFIALGRDLWQAENWRARMRALIALPAPAPPAERPSEASPRSAASESTWRYGSRQSV